jgi:hypothetical protein
VGDLHPELTAVIAQSRIEDLDPDDLREARALLGDLGPG